MKVRKFNAAVALGSLTATVALLAGLSSAHAQAPGAGSFPGSILIPGTNTSFKVGGYVKGDYFYDFGQQQGRDGGVSSPGGLALDNNGKAPAGTLPGAGHSIHGTSQLSAAESRFNIETRTPTGYGELKTYIEGDFTDPNGLTHSKTFQLETNSNGFRLRYAYGTLGPFLVGQYNSVFRDSASEAETLDFSGAQVAGATRQPQFRYTYDFGGGLLFAVAAENPQVQWFDTTTTATSVTTFSTGQGNKIPDFTGSAVWNAPWGHLAGRAVARDIYDHNGGPGGTGGTSSPGANASFSKFGWGLGVSGDLKTFGKDDFFGQVNGGDGIGRYLQNFGNVAEFVVNPGPTAAGGGGISLISGWGVMAGYQHWWTDTLRSTAVFSFVKINIEDAFKPASTAGAVLGTLNDRLYTGHINLIWSPVPQVDTGIEYIWNKRRTIDSQTGTGNRLQVSTKFKF